jgi:hypothetical protein
VQGTVLHDHVVGEWARERHAELDVRGIGEEPDVAEGLQRVLEPFGK